MCGIFGICNYQQKPVDARRLRETSAILSHRGPDDEGFLLYRAADGAALPCSGGGTDPRIDLPPVDSGGLEGADLALGFRRLAIIDLSPAGHQPMASADGRCWIVFNGEIYNYIELREELEAQGFAFRSTSDTEVLLSAYACWGEAMLPKLVGMFAFCIFDMNRRQLFLARDFFGIKPLLYCSTGGGFAFASELKGLLSLLDLNRRANAQVVYQYLRYSICDASDQTFLEGVRQLLPAHSMIVDLAGGAEPVQNPYWALDTTRRSRLSFDEASAEMRRLFLENIRLHLRSDVPVGACLSGGIDSSSVVMAMRRQTGENLDLHTFSYVAEDASINEERYMDLVCSRAGATKHKVTFGPADLVRDIDTIIRVQEQPFMSTSMYAQYRVFKLAGEAGIKVTEDGQGADEMLGGYLPYASARLASLISSRSLYKAAVLSRASLRQGVGAPLLFRRAFGFLIPPGARSLLRGLSGGERSIPWLNQTWFAGRNTELTDPFVKQRSGDYLRQDLALALTRTSLPMLLRYEDRNSMAFSIESRLPFLTPALAEFVFSLPEEYIIDSTALTKAVFRDAMRGLVPGEILSRRDKIGFATPEKNLLALLSPWVETTLQSEAARAQNAVRYEAASREWQAILQGRARFDGRMWRILNLIRWSEIFEVQV